MASKRKEFEFDDGDYGFNIEVNEELGKFKYTAGSGKNIDDHIYKEEYEFRLTKDRKIEVKLTDDLIEDVFGRTVAHMVNCGDVDEDEIDKIYSNLGESRDKKIQDLKSKVQWHEEKNHIVMLCLLDGDKKAVESLRREIETARNKLIESCKTISTELVARLGAELDTSAGWVKVKNREDLGEKLNTFFEKSPNIFGLSNWDDFYNYPVRVDYYNKVLDDSLKIISSDVWTDEMFAKEIEENISDAFPAHEDNHCFTFLDGKYLKSSLKEWIKPALSKVEVKDAWKFFKEYGHFLSDFDFALNGGGDPKPNSEFAYPALAQVEDLERITGEYLKNKDWQSDYFDWILIGVFLQRETIAFTREVGTSVNRMGFFQKMKMKESIKSAGDLIVRYARLAQIASARTYSLNELLTNCRETQAAKGFVHPCVSPLIENRIAKGKTVLTFPTEARSPEQMEQINAKRLKKQA